MGKFIDTQRRDTVEGVTSFQRSLIDHDLYTFNAQGRGTKVTYYNINKDKSMLDVGSEMAYTDIGEDSPIRFNKIKDLYIYQMNRLEVNLESNDYGMEANELSGDSFILPTDDLQPMDGDFFTIDYSKHTWLFQVRDASMSNLNDDNLVWKISWVLDRTTNEDILKNVVEEYQYIEQTEGTNTKRIILSTNYELAKKIDDIAESLRMYFKDLFYSDLIQSFTYKWYNEYRMYDPYAIEFIIRNNLLGGKGSSYMYIDHIKKPPVTFGVSYSRSCFRAFEMRDKKKIRKYSYQAQANAITDPTTIFATRYDTYYELCYDIIHEPNGPLNPRPIIPIMDEDLIDRIIENKYYDPLVEEYSSYLNIVIKFFNNRDINEKDLGFLDHIDFTPQESLFYNILFVLYALDWYTEKLLN